MKNQLRKVRAISILALGLMMALAFVPRTTSAATVTSTDFQSQSFSKVVDWYDYVRQYAAANGFTPPNSTEHAYIYANYINVGGFQLFSAGLVNVTHNNVNFVTIPLQTFFEHYKTPGGKDVITASSFISLVAFKENSTTDIYPNSPDKGDEIYASFNLGVNLTALTGHKMPSPVSTAQITPLTSQDSNHYSWGLKYTNLNAMWWKINPDPFFPCCIPTTPRGLAQYTDLTHTAVNTAASDGERAFRADFGVKPQYNLYNYTKDPSEATYASYNVNTRTVNRAGWGANPVFWFQKAFMGFLPIFVAHVDPGLVQQARTGMVSFTITDYLYIISYPTWNGYRIVNDPAYTAYYEPTSPSGILTAIFLAVAVAAGIGGVFAFLFRRKRITSIPLTGTAGPAPYQP